MKILWDPPPEIQASGFRSAARRFGWVAERCSTARWDEKVGLNECSKLRLAVLKLRRKGGRL
jgi:hypothetical protein